MKDQIVVTVTKLPNGKGKFSCPCGEERTFNYYKNAIECADGHGRNFHEDTFKGGVLQVTKFVVYLTNFSNEKAIINCSCGLEKMFDDVYLAEEWADMHGDLEHPDNFTGVYFR